MCLGQYWYQNMNFGLCRIPLATINRTIPVDFSLPPLWGMDALNDIVWDLITLAGYESYVATNVFSPSGVSGPALKHQPLDALAYDFPVSGAGWNSGDLTTMAGGAGWHMAVDEMLAFPLNAARVATERQWLPSRSPQICRTSSLPASASRWGRCGATWRASTRAG